MVTVTPNHVPALRAACLFAGNKYRLITGIAGRFNDEEVLRCSEASEALYQRLGVQLPSINEPRDVAVVITALDGLIDEVNRQWQKLIGAGAAQEGAMLEHRIRELYAAREHLVALQSDHAQEAA
jgi:ribose 5-phosphate isomerase